MIFEICSSFLKPKNMLLPPTKYLDGLHSASIFLVALLVLLVKQTLSSPIDVISNPIRVSWSDKQSTRLDFIFNLEAPFKNDFKLESISPNSLVSCVGYSACLLKDGKLFRAYKPHQLISDQKPHKFLFTSIEKGTFSQANTTITSSNSSSPITTCTKSDISVYHYCSTHWNPPIHIVGDNCSHTIEWHSPYTCEKENTNYEHPCYTHDDKGRLVDLTPWILSNGSSYSIDLGTFNATIKKFNLNVCNEAHEACGPHVSSCYVGESGPVDSGFNNLTSLKYDAKAKTAVLTSLGQFNQLCPDQRVKTVVRFLCEDKVISDTRPRLIGSTACENTIEWETVHACPVAEIQKPATECAIKNEVLGIDINLRQVFKNATFIEVPNISIDGKEKKMVLGLCRGINTTYLKCEGKATSTISACLLDSQDNSTIKNSTNSQIVGSITNSLIKLTDNRVYLESFAPNKSCQVSMGRNFSATHRVGTRIEFFCSQLIVDKPTYMGYEDCVHVFEWGTPKLCVESTQKGIISDAILNNISTLQNKTTSTTNKTGTIPHSKLSDEELKINMDPKPKTALEMHQKTMDDTKKIYESVSEDHMAKENGESTIKIADKSNGTEQKTSPVVMPPTSTANESKLNEPTSLPDSRMNKWHKFFMIALIVVSLAGFIVVIFILDNKTRLGFPLGNLRRQARQAFQPAPVPYSRVDNFSNHLDL